MISSKKNNPENFSAVILSAGKSERFGKPKALLPFNLSQTFLQRLIEEYHAAGIKQIVVVVNLELEPQIKKVTEKYYSNQKLTIAVNRHASHGRFTSVQAGLNSVASSKGIFIQNVDNPFTTSELLKEMMQEMESNKYVAPIYKGEKGHPILFSKEIAEHIRRIKNSDSNLREVISDFESVEVENDDEGILANINSQEVYSKYFTNATAD